MEEAALRTSGALLKRARQRSAAPETGRAVETSGDGSERRPVGAGWFWRSMWSGFDDSQCQLMDSAGPCSSLTWALPFWFHQALGSRCLRQTHDPT